MRLRTTNAILPLPKNTTEAEKVRNLEYCYHHAEDGILEEPNEFKNRKWGEVREDIIKYIEKKGYGKRKVQYHLHDWSVSRQRYWGTPVPIIHCDKCGLVPVPEKDLPVSLPDKVDFTPKGKAPLETAEDWINTKCSKCGGKAKRDAETLDGFFDNSWYFLRYLDPQNENKIFDGEIAKKWMPVDIYFGGAEHTLGHTLYSRFFIKFLFSAFVIFVIDDMHHIPSNSSSDFINNKSPLIALTPFFFASFIIPSAISTAVTSKPSSFR